MAIVRKQAQGSDSQHREESELASQTSYFQCSLFIMSQPVRGLELKKKKQKTLNVRVTTTKANFKHFHFYFYLFFGQLLNNCKQSLEHGKGKK